MKRLLHFLEYDNRNCIHQPNVNHHLTNTGNPNYIDLKKSIEKGNDQGRPLSFISFEFVLYKLSDHQPFNDEKLYKKSTVAIEKTNAHYEKEREVKRAFFVQENDESYNEFLALFKKDLEYDKKTASLANSIKKFQESNKCRIGIVDGLHRLTAYNNIISDPENKNSVEVNFDCECNMYYIKETEDVNERNKNPQGHSFYSRLLSDKSLHIAKDSSKSMLHTLYDGITDVLLKHDKQEEALKKSEKPVSRYVTDIRKKTIATFTNPNEKSLEGENYFDEFSTYHTTLLEKCPAYHTAFQEQLGRSRAKHSDMKSTFDKESLKIAFASIYFSPHTLSGIASLHKDDQVQNSLPKKTRFSLSCASVHRLISSYLTFDDDIQKKLKAGIEVFQCHDLINLKEIQLTVAYAEVLATTFTTSFKRHMKVRDLIIGQKKFNVILSNYFVTSLLDGMRTLHNLEDDPLMNILTMCKSDSNEATESNEATQNNIFYNSMSEEDRNSIDWQRHPFVTIMGIYFNYARHLFLQPFLANINEGFVKILKTTTSDLKDYKGHEDLFLPEKITLQLKNSEDDNASNNDEEVPISFAAFIKTIIGKDGWLKGNPEETLQNYKDYTNIEDIKKKGGKQVGKGKKLIRLANKESFDNYREWYEEHRSRYTKKQITDISLNIIEALERNAKNCKLITSTLEEQIEKTGPMPPLEKKNVSNFNPDETSSVEKDEEISHDEDQESSQSEDHDFRQSETNVTSHADEVPESDSIEPILPSSPKRSPRIAESERKKRQRQNDKK